MTFPGFPTPDRSEVPATVHPRVWEASQGQCYLCKEHYPTDTLIAYGFIIICPLCLCGYELHPRIDFRTAV